MKLFMNILIATILVQQITAFAKLYACKNGQRFCPGKINIACEQIKLCAGAHVIQLNAIEKEKIVQAHNKHRNDIANGNYGYPTAVKMATMEWDNELAGMAELNVRRCKFQHDECRNTEQYQYSGQNMAMSYGSAIATFDRSTVVNTLVPFVNNWFNEYRVCPLNVIQFFHSSPNPNIRWGHFTVMVADRNTKVGCAAVWYPGYILFACNYATNNMEGFPVYAQGPTASKCKTGVNPQYKRLCSRNEHYHINDWFKLYL